MIKIIIYKDNVKKVKAHLYKYFDNAVDEDIYDLIKKTKAKSVDELIEKLNSNKDFNFLYKIQKGELKNDN